MADKLYIIAGPAETTVPPKLKKTRAYLHRNATSKDPASMWTGDVAWAEPFLFESTAANVAKRKGVIDYTIEAA